MSKRDRSKPADLSVVMVRITVRDDGSLAVTVDGAPYLPPEFSPPWQRGSFPAIVDAISQHTGCTLRVDVIETDGRVMTDFYTSRLPRRRAEPSAEMAAQHAQHAPAVAAAPVTPPPRLVQFAGSGMVPGEDVAVAIVIAHTETGPDGIARALIDSRYLDHAPTGEAILLGRISATVCIGRPQ
ncbi:MULTISPECIES: hypothetical protein [Leucobacter]|uniref:Uncharacterized protein n=2 Tax=Leucobacter TaxID=55968 RepID=A0A4Q7U3Q0_9MICO|nr:MULTISPECIES: hypothetical protein [Leucobacter]MBL3691077.1 hypothetical protein [Leucobacter chromiireducens subsp. chromiireducens]MBL3700846.1 hypothetical protein [Leucobacter luti]RZT68315.1 hypothetical protein EV139_0037 [Leucobacter luti]